MRFLVLALALAGCNRGPARHEGASFAVDADGKTYAWTTGPGAGNSLKLRGSDGKVKVVASGAYFEGPTLSPDGKTILIATGAAFRAKLSIAKIDLATGKRETFADVKDQSHYSPTYSPDGKWVAYRSAAKPRSQSLGGVQWLDYDLYVVDAEGKSPRRLTTFKAERMTAPRWSPNGKTLTTAVSDREGRTWIREIDLEGKIVHEVEGQNNESMPVYLGDKLLIVSDRDNVGRYRVGYLDWDKGTLTPMNKADGYFLDPQVAGGKVFVLEDVAHKMRFRLAEIDPATGSIKEVVAESEFDERK